MRGKRSPGEVGGIITHELGVINAVAAALTNDQLRALKATRGVIRVSQNASVELAGKKGDEGENCDGDCDGNGNNNGSDQETFYPELVGADLLHQQGIDGSGVAIAVIDTGIWVDRSLTLNAHGQDRVSASYDAIQDAQIRPARSRTDDSGHGSHVTSVAISSRSANGKYNGLAPGADLVAVKAFDGNGHGTYADVIRGIDWIISKKSRYDIGVLNLSFSATPQSHYWDDPLNQAVMRAWQAGIVVVVSAGNGGPGAMSIGVPGNVPM